MTDVVVKRGDETIAVSLGGAQGPLGITFDTPPAPGSFLTKAAGADNRKYVGVVGATPANAVAATDLASSAGATLVGANLGPGTVPASAQDALRWVTKADLSTYGVGDGVSGSYGQDAVLRAVANGAKYVRFPAGQFVCNDLIGVVDQQAAGITVEGEGAQTLVKFSGGARGFSMDGIRPAVRNMHIHLLVAMQGAVACAASYMEDAVVEDVTVSMEPGVNSNAFLFVGSFGGEINGLHLRNLVAKAPQRIGLEVVNQGNSERRVLRRLLIENFSCFQPTNSSSPNFAPAISLDGLLVNPKIRGVYVEDSPGSAIELVEANNADVSDVTLVRPVGAILAATGARPVISPKASGWRIYDPVAEVQMAIPSASGAVLADMDLFSCRIENGQAPDTELIDLRMTSSNRFIIYNGGGAGGGARMKVSGGTYRHAYAGSDGAILQCDPGGDNTTLTGSRLYKAPSSPYFGGTGSKAAGGYFKDDVFVPNGL